VNLLTGEKCFKQSKAIHVESYRHVSIAMVSVGIATHRGTWFNSPGNRVSRVQEIKRPNHDHHDNECPPKIPVPLGHLMGAFTCHEEKRNKMTKCDKV